MSNPNYPASTLAAASALTIADANVLHEIINGDDTESITVDDGPIPSLRKALKDNFYYKDEILWNNGQSVTEFNQLVKFTDGTLWLAPTARADNPILMGATPVGDVLWSLSLFSADTRFIARSFNVKDTEVIDSTNGTEVLDNVLYIYDVTDQVVWGKPTLNGSGETITDVTGSALTTTGGSYTLVDVSLTADELNSIPDSVTYTEDLAATFTAAQALTHLTYSSDLAATFTAAQALTHLTYSSDLAATFTAAQALTHLNYAKSMSERSWQDVVGSRASETIYTNNTGYDIEVSISVISNATAQGLILSFEIDSVSILTEKITSTTGNLDRISVNITVPNGSDYQVLPLEGSSTIDKWMELR
jgi:hypothetical protein